MLPILLLPVPEWQWWQSTASLSVLESRLLVRKWLPMMNDGPLALASREMLKVGKSATLYA